MPYENYINLDKSERDRPIYRIMQVRRLLQCFEEKCLALVPPRKWDDPFENLLLSSKVFISESGETVGMEPIRDKVYGQCWTQHRETDAMWRIYSADTNGVKVRTTPQRLLEALMRSNERFADIYCFIGKVIYLQQSKLFSSLMALDLYNSNGSGLAKSLLYKRLEFRHEREVRLIYTDCEGPVHSFEVNPIELFDEIVFDPRMNKYLLKAYLSTIINYGFKGRVEQSALYKPPEKLMIRI